MAARGKAWTLTLRHGPRVERLRFERLDEAVAELEDRLKSIRSSEGPLGSAKMFREYGPERRVQARAEISRGGPLRSVTAGVDLMGDGTFVPYRGSVRRRPLEFADSSPFEAVRRDLESSD